MNAIEITRLASATGPLTKRISLSESGGLVSDGSACLMTAGTATRLPLVNLHAFADLLGRLEPNQAIALGALKSDLPDEVEITTARRLAEMNGSAPRHVISRTADHIAYRVSEPALCLVDVDVKGMTRDVVDLVRSHGGFWASLVAVLPDLVTVRRAVRTSTSSGITRSDTGEALRGSDGLHVFLHVQDGADVERFLRTLHDRCWLAGLGWFMVGAGGQLLERSLIDRMVYAGERLVFEAPPLLMAPLLQDACKRAPIISGEEIADTRHMCPDLTIVEKAKLKTVKATARAALAGPAAKVRTEFVGIQAIRLAERLGCTVASARHTVERQCEGTLLPDVVLPFDADDMAGCTVADVLKAPSRFVGATMADPLEGVAYGRCKAKVMQRGDGTVWIHSFAHGRTVYELKHDAKAIETAVRAAPPGEVVDLFVRLLLNADLQADEEQNLRDLVRDITGVKARPLDATIKAARKGQKQRRGQEDSDSRAANRTDSRLAIPAPQPDAERLPVMQMLDEALGGSTRPVPPIRDLDGHPIEVRTRPPMMLHELTSQGSNQNEARDTRLPPPALPLLTTHNRFSLAHEIERHIEFVAESTEGDRPVALPGTFIEHFIAYRDSRLPRVGAIVTAPLVMPDGSLLAPKGLDRGRKLVFQIEPRLMDLLPKPAECTPEATGKALDFLCSKWLCDVSTDFDGKCVLVALALTIIERVLLPERPAFFITAGKRGGGKTTAIMMLILAVTGKKPAAAAWSPSEEERRKAILAYLAEGLTAMVWDNIPLGTSISCPTLEKVLTAESYSDRILGQSNTITVPAFTVMTFTGNNIGPKGDMASRSLSTRLEVDRIDPENRSFTHADPVGWTLANRGAILRALYTILLANPQLRAEQRQEPKTRFKTWWSLVGAAVEYAAAALSDQQRALPDDPDLRYADDVDFTRLFARIESDDEEGALLADVLDVLYATWPTRTFVATEVANLINEPMTGEEDRAKALRAYFDDSGKRREVRSRLG